MIHIHELVALLSRHILSAAAPGTIGSHYIALVIIVQQHSWFQLMAVIGDGYIGSGESLLPNITP